MGSRTIYASEPAPGYAGLYIAKLEVDVWSTLWVVRSGVDAKIESTFIGPNGARKKKVDQLGLHITLIGNLETSNGRWTSALHNFVVGNHFSKTQVDEFEVKWSTWGRYVRVIRAVNGRDMRVRGIEATGSVRDGGTFFKIGPLRLVKT